MADSTISGLPFGTTLDGTEAFPCDQHGLTVQVSSLVIADYVLTFFGGGGGPPGFNFSDQEIPVGVINGVNTAFTLLHIPFPAKSIIGYIRQGGVGAFLPAMVGIDFTVLGTVLTMTNAPHVGSNLFFYYRY